jgi:molybdate transport system substrate-binding protein
VTTIGRGLALLATTALLVAACGGAGASPSSRAASAAATAPPVTIFGASSLKGVLDRMKTAWESSHPGSTLTISTDSSSALETQIEQGAPADVFLSADASNPKKLADKGLTDGAAIDFAGNLLTVIVPVTNPAKITSPKDLAKGGIKVIAAGDDVPVTKYAMQVVHNLASEPGYPPSFASSYMANVASKEDNVSAVVTKVALGEGDAAIVYVTDARAEPKVTPVEIPRDANVLATYAGVVNKPSANAATAHEFLAWVAGPEGQAILATFGFLPPSSAG